MQRLTLFGYGTTTKAIAKRFAPCNVFDDHVHKPFKDAWGNQLFPSHMFNPATSLIEIPSPGIAPTHPLITKANHLTSEYDFFAPSMPFSIWISGTNGKTTTTQMLQHLLAKRGSVAGGNIGTPLSELNESANIWLLESSSFTLHYTKQATPSVYVLLPITQDHIDWHGSFEAYEAAKLSPIARMQEFQTVILPAKYRGIKTFASTIFYENVEDIATFIGIDTAKINFSGAFLLDAVLALATQKILFDSLEYDTINAFAIEANRQERFFDAHGRPWINDTKATNADATIALLEALPMNQPIHLILGGDDKGASLDALFTFLKDRHVLLYAIGKNAKKIEQLCKEHNITLTLCETLQNAVNAISKHHTTSSLAILSPAAASLDQFNSYKERGETFKALVEKLS